MRQVIITKSFRLIVLISLLFSMLSPTFALSTNNDLISDLSALEPFEGTWVAKKVKSGDYFLPIEYLGFDIEIEIIGNVVYITSEAFNANHDPQIYNFFDGILYYEDEELSSEIKCNDSGMLEFSLFDDEYTMVFLLDKKEEIKSEDNNSILCKKNGVIVYITNRFKFTDDYLYVEIIIENNTDNSIRLDIDSASIEEWQVSASLDNDTVASHKKRKGTIKLNLNDTDIVNIGAVSYIEFAFKVYDHDTWRYMFDMDGIFIPPKSK